MRGEREVKVKKSKDGKERTSCCWARPLMFLPQPGQWIEEVEKDKKGEGNNKRTKCLRNGGRKRFNYAYVPGAALESQSGGRKEGEEREAIR